MQKSTLWTTALALFATLALAALPAAARTPDPPVAAPSAVAPQSAPAATPIQVAAAPIQVAAAPIHVEPAPIEQAKPLKCGPGEHAFSTTFFFFASAQDCEAGCTSYCQDNSGYLLSWDFSQRGLTCSCTCCA